MRNGKRRIMARRMLRVRDEWRGMVSGWMTRVDLLRDDLEDTGTAM